MYPSIMKAFAFLLVGAATAQNYAGRELWQRSAVDSQDEDPAPAPLEQSLELSPRQDENPPTTYVAQCDMYDGYFYVTPRNYTWQLQCAKNYQGSSITAQNAANYSACINECIDYNRAHGAGACIAITFNGPSDGSQGLCTLWALIDDTPLLADESGNLQDSAVLIEGPDGTVYATPRPEPSFSGQPTQPPTVDPVPTSTASTTTITSTNIIIVTSCPASISCGALSSTTTTNSTMQPTDPPSVVTTTTRSVSLSNGGVHLINTTIASQSPPPTFPPSLVVGGQTTYTTVKPYTEYIIEVVNICEPSPGPCTVCSKTLTTTGYRTQLSCPPGVCNGAMVNNQVDAAFTAATCVVSA